MGKIIREIESSTIDFATGEITEKITHRVKTLSQEPPFVKVYLDDIVSLYNLPARSSNMIHVLLTKMDYEGIISLNAASKRRMAAQLGTSLSVIDNQLSSLSKTKVLQRLDRGEYMFNPNLFAKGFWADIKKLRDKFIELKISYNTKTEERKISTSIREINGEKT